jgi:hypothetical protein
MIYTPDRSILAPARCRRCGRFRIPPRTRRRYASRWLRPFTSRAMAAGDVMLDADGNVLLTSDGNVLLDDGSGDPCACCGGTIGNGLACSNCSNTPPAGFICTITGCDICTGCQAGIGQSATYTGDAVNGTYTLNNT